MSSTAKIISILGLCIAVLWGLVLVIGVLDRSLIDPLAVSFDQPWIARIPLAWVILGLVVVLPGRWTAIPKRLQVRGEVDIAASPGRIWDVISPRTRSPYWSAAITHTTVHPDDPTRIDFHFSDGNADDVFARTPLQAVIHAEVPEEYFAYRYLNAHAFPGMAADLDLSEYFLEEVTGGTRVTQIEHLRRIRLSTIPLLLFLNPSRDALVRLKAVIEGKEDNSWMGRTARQLAEDEA